MTPVNQYIITINQNKKDLTFPSIIYNLEPEKKREIIPEVAHLKA